MHVSGGDDPDEWFFTQPVQTGEYTIVLAIGSKEVTEKQRTIFPIAGMKKGNVNSENIECKDIG